MKILLSLVLSSLLFLYAIPSTLNPIYAITDPLSVPNNKFGIHIITPTPQESSPAAELINTNGDWGYITVLIESKDRNEQKWQSFFNDLRRRHLIPLVRLATHPEGNSWKRPYEGEEVAWADFLDNLIWPVKNRYVIIYNEPNHATEWGGQVDPKSYARHLDKTIDALKKKSEDFFVLNAGFDASAPNKTPNYLDQETFMRQMNGEVPGIFNKLDGWVSHSYPNPGFLGSPDDTGQGTIRSWFWELQILRQLGVGKNLPVFITETGWKHSDGKYFDKNLPSPERVSDFYKQAFEDAWSSSRIVAVTPFLLNYQEPPFDHFSFKKITGEAQNQKLLGVQFPEYHPQFYALKNLPKVRGKPIQEFKAQLTEGKIYPSIVAGEHYQIQLKFKNIGQSIWNESEPIYLIAKKGAKELGIGQVSLPSQLTVEPGQEYTFALSLNAPQGGIFEIELNLFHGNNEFANESFKFTTEVKSPVILKVHSTLKWKNNFAGEYLLKILGAVQTQIQIAQDPNGYTREFEARQLLPDLTYNFTLTKPFYQPKTITQKLNSGINELDFGELQPDIPSAVFNLKALWQILPFSG